MLRYLLLDRISNQNHKNIRYLLKKSFPFLYDQLKITYILMHLWVISSGLIYLINGDCILGITYLIIINLMILTLKRIMFRHILQALIMASEHSPKVGVKEVIEKEL